MRRAGGDPTPPDLAPPSPADVLVHAALAVSRAGGHALFSELTQDLARQLDVDAVFVATFTDDSHARLRTLAVVLDGQLLSNFEYAIASSPCAAAVGQDFRFVASGVAREFEPGTLFHAKAIDSYASHTLTDRSGRMLGLLVAMKRAPIAKPTLVEAVLKIHAVRMAAEIQRLRSEETLRKAALAVSRARGQSVYAELARYLASVLDIEIVLISRLDSGSSPVSLRTLARHVDGELLDSVCYPLTGGPCETILGNRFNVYPDRVAEHFPEDRALEQLGVRSYAGIPLTEEDGSPLGVLAIMSRRPMHDVGRIEPILQIFAVRIESEFVRLRTENALRISEASYRSIFEAAEDPIFVHDWESGAIVDVNPAACRVYGYSSDELRRVSVADLSSGSPPYTIEEALRWVEMAKSGRSVRFEWHRRNRDGSLHWDEVRLKSAQIGGQPRILAFTREITERKLAEEALRASEEQYRTIFDASEDAIYVHDRDTDEIVDVNPRAIERSGYRREQLIGKQVWQRVAERVTPQTLGEARQAMQRAKSGEVVRFEMRRRNDDGSWGWDEIWLKSAKLGGKQRILAVVRPISERKRREEAVARSEARLRATVEASIDCVIGMDADGRIVEFNPAAQRTFGYSRNDVIGRSLGDTLVPPRLRAAHEEGMRRYRLTRHGAFLNRRVEITAMRADGSEFPAELAIGVATAADGDFFVGYLRDISDRQQAERQRAELEAQLRQAQKMEAIGHLTGGIAHDFNNILTSVLGYIVLVTERAELRGDTDTIRQLGLAQSAAQKARDLIGQMLAFSRRQHGDRRPRHLAPLVEQAVQLLRPTLPATIDIDVAIEADVPPAAADPVQIEQVLFNLCINARDAIRGPGTIRIGLQHARISDGVCASCRGAVSGRWIVATVADTGSGIPADVMERMFDPFYSTKEVGQGSGMGLAIVHGIVHEHGGHVLVDSRVDQGTSFSVCLPQASESAQPVHPVPKSATPRRALSGRVMVVEDQPLVGEFMLELLQSWGLQVTLHLNPIGAHDAFLHDPQAVDLVITDHTMPKMTGAQLAASLTAIRPDLPVLLYTGFGAGLDLPTLARAGVAEVLRKPIDPDALRDQLHRWLAPVQTDATSA